MVAPDTMIDQLEARNRLLSQLVNTYERMTSMVIQGSDVATVTQLFAELVGRAVTVLDPTLQPLATHAPRTPGLAGQATDPDALLAAMNPLLRQVLDTLVEGRRPLRMPLSPEGSLASESCVLAPIIGGGDEVLGYLALLGGTDEETEVDLFAAQHAATMYALVLMRRQIAADIGNKLRADLIEGLLSGQLEDARERALYLGYDASRSHRVLVMVPEAGAAGSSRPDSPAGLALRRRVLDTLAELVGRSYSEAIVVARSGELVVVAPDDGSENDAVSTSPRGELVRSSASPKALAQEVTERLEQVFPQVRLTVGVGSICREPSDLARSYSHARRALGAAQRFGKSGEITAIEDLGIFRLLYQVNDPRELDAFAEALLGSLIAYDRQHDADLLKTLDAYLRHKGSIQHAARELFLHPNTVSYRMRRIVEIAGIDLDDNETRLSLQIGLKIVQGLDFTSVT